MIIAPEQAALKAQQQFDALRDFVQPAADEGQRIDSVERGLIRRLLALGPTLLSTFVARQGDGDLGPQAETAEGQFARRLPEPHDRRYASIFGELTITRVVYGTRAGQKIERVPLDERLGLPEGDFSYVLEDWGQRLRLKESFAEAGQSLEMLLGLRRTPRPSRRRWRSPRPPMSGTLRNWVLSDTNFYEAGRPIRPLGSGMNAVLLR